VVSCNGIIRAYCFKDADEHLVTVNIERCIELMRRELIPELRWKPGVDVDTVIYLQDGATPHCSNALRKYLPHCFPRDSFISHRM